MRKLQNVLYVTTQGAYLNKDGQAVAVQIDGKEAGRFPIHNLKGIVVFGRVACSPYLMHFCAENEVSIAFCDENGHFLARVQGPVSGNVLLRRAQYRVADTVEGAARMTMFLLAGKLANTRAVLRRFCRDHEPENQPVRLAIRQLSQLIDGLRQATEVEVMRGIEGKAADVYFGVFDHLILNKSDEFQFQGRSRRPPLDRVNALLSFAYTILLNEVVGALESVGLDPASGFLHCDRPGRASLALDMLEEYRACLGDRLSLSLINLKQIGAGDFQVLSNGAVWLNDEGRKKFLTAWQQRKQEIVVHPVIGEKIPVGLLFWIQARLLAKYLRGEVEAYVPYIWK
ncbi:type I-C CRISPR-associated endonuclease Cas1c [Victivallis sp. Marseille-Q1083]|uniref:type I-C CRISPR-associated endonuclease Cas1c n=1 Tax=Victivallis sp. Marseille-Q1083 TaxID=2717288 RepID=UPI00158A6B91|nr:type I-C CRISPR-associated endonuclease Cas1c [Victivallis sp. Marseille-Q1083]